jgi:hypothetical protein
MGLKMVFILVLVLCSSVVLASSVYCSSWFCVQVEKDNTISDIGFSDPLINNMRPELKQQVLNNCFSDPLCSVVSNPRLVGGN